MKLITAVPFLVFAAATSVSVAGAELEDRRLKTKPSSSSKGKVCTCTVECANAKFCRSLFRLARNFASAHSALIHCNPFISLSLLSQGKKGKGSSSQAAGSVVPDDFSDLKAVLEGLLTVIDTRAESGESDEVIPDVATASPSWSPSLRPSSPPTVERLCNTGTERQCRDKCFKDKGCGGNDDVCKKRCRSKCCSWRK
mmetsp:Transcript_31727/g.64560  ORF Transcript_31727/g.64560 Transcript_31727/m.64560 type:complete len:198 (+) Transcript_31727:807-1400(+)